MALTSRLSHLPPPPFGRPTRSRSVLGASLWQRLQLGRRLFPGSTVRHAGGLRLLIRPRRRLETGLISLEVEVCFGGRTPPTPFAATLKGQFHRLPSTFKAMHFHFEKLRNSNHFLARRGAVSTLKERKKNPPAQNSMLSVDEPFFFFTLEGNKQSCFPRGGAISWLPM